MNLKSLELYGFKSFPDKVRLAFEDGMTAVVGPNGSGKSNISDAVRWVLGEQSTKNLRGSRMEDVIFNGTQTRKAQGYSQVTISFDNSGRHLNFDNDEVSITRRYYRSGESEYRINEVSVRLMDVQELLMDTGLGHDGYSLIGQGKIDEIVSNKSSQRREIFEEAAGISKFKHRRHIATRDLERAQENLLRLTDILAEIESRVEPLREQSEKAKEFLALSAEKKTIEISLWIENLESLRRLLRTHQDNVLAAQSERDSYDEKLEEIELKINDRFEAMQRCLVDIEALRIKIREEEQVIAAGSSESAVAQNDITHAEREIERIAKEFENFSTMQQELNANVKALAAQIDLKNHEKVQIDEQMKSDMEAVLAKQSEINALDDELSGVEAKRQSLLDAASNARIELETSKSIIDETTNRLADIDRGFGAFDAEISRFEDELLKGLEFEDEINAKIESLNNTISGYELKLSVKDKNYNELAAEVKGLETQADAAKQRSKVLSDLENALDGYSHSVKYVLKNAHNGIFKGVCGSVSDIISTAEQYTVAIETALGAAMQNVVVENERAAKTIIAALKRENAGRATFLPLDSIKGSAYSHFGLERMPGFVSLAHKLIKNESRYNNIIEFLLGRVIVARTLDDASEIARKINYSCRVVSLDGQVINAGGSYTGGSALRSAGMLSRKIEIDNLDQKVIMLNSQVENLSVELKTMMAQRNEIIAIIDGINAEIKTHNEDIIRVKAESGIIEKSIADTKLRKENAQKEYEAIKTRIKLVTDQSKDSGDVLEAIGLEVAALDTEIEKLQAQRGLHQDTMNELNETLSQRRLEAMKLESEIQMLGGNFEALRLQNHAREESARDFDTKKAGLEEHIKQLFENMEAIKGKIMSAQGSIDEYNELIAQKMNERTLCEQQSSELRAEEKALMNKRSLIDAEAARLEERAGAVQRDYDNIIAKMWEEYELTPRQAEEFAEKITSKTQAQTQLGKLRNRIKALGSVNLSAIEEYKEVSERYVFLKTQIDDATKSRDELLSLIKDLTVKMRAMFAESFEKINGYFTDVFKEMFGGGNAYLKLSESAEDILEAGIEIFAEPPGKKINNLMALSGGEKALVAISIYFAILKYKPAPFVMLDEIEAALDDVNVNKFAEYVKNLSRNSQFIVITHRRGTMEQADLLYGVTMQEEGVSKLLAMTLEQARQMAKIG